MICEAFGSTFYLFKDTFDAVALPVRDVVKAQAKVVQGRFQPRGAIDQKHGVCDVVFLSEIAEKQLGHGGRSRRKQPDVEGSVGCGIDGGK